MTKTQKIIKGITYISTGFTAAHGLLYFLLFANSKLYSMLIYHYSEELTWYILFFALPFVAGLAFYFWLKGKSISKGIKILFGLICILQLAFTLTAAIKNSNYWGYSFKRPAVFNEIEHASMIFEYSRVFNSDSTGLKPLYKIVDTTSDFTTESGREDPYYGTIARLFWVLEDISRGSGGLYDFPKARQEENRNISISDLKNIDGQIQRTGMIDKGEKPYYDHLGELSGVITKFQADDSAIYIFTGLKGRQISNDHYPFYEFLFLEKNGNCLLIKKQKFYTDFAGIEGLEYANIAPLFSLLLTLVGVLSGTIILIVNRIIKKIRSKGAKGVPN